MELDTSKIKFKDLTVTCKYWEDGQERKVISDGEVIKVGKYHNKKFVKIGESTAEVRRIVELGGKLLVEPMDDRYYVVTTPLDEFVYLASNKGTDEVPVLDGEFIDTNIIQCDKISDIIWAVDKIPDSKYTRAITWNNPIGEKADYCYDGGGQRLLHIKYHKKGYSVNVEKRWIITSLGEICGPACSMTVINLKDHKQKLVYIDGDYNYRTAYSTSNSLRITDGFNTLSEFIDEDNIKKYMLTFSRDEPDKLILVPY